MTDNNHPITPPPDLIRDWCASKIHAQRKIPGHVHVAIQAARWGADQELEACCEWLCDVDRWKTVADRMRNARRPKPPSLKEQALALISHDPENQPFLGEEGIDIIRRALESLPD